MGSMGMVLDRARRYAEVYRTESENAWGEIKAHHDQAMVVRGVEDVMDLGIGVMKSWFRTAGFWHEWVSEDHKRYEEKQHQVLAHIESNLIKTTQAVLDAVDHVKKWGFEVDGEPGFRELADSLVKCAMPIDDSHFLKKLGKLEREARTGHERGELEEIGSWGE